jgi:plastocyanin
MTTRSRGGTDHRITIAAFAAGLLVVVACGSGDRSTDASATARSGTEVVMRLIAFKPARLEVSVAAAVTWKQQDAGFHTVTSGIVRKEPSGSVVIRPDETFDSGRIAKGDDFTFTFDDAGTYDYFCRVHPATMTGRITVG